MPSIAGYPLISLQGAPVPVVDQIQTWTRPGQDGIGVTKIGRRGQPFVMVSMVDVADADQAAAATDTFCAMQGGFVSVDSGSSGFHGNLLVLHVDPVEPVPIANSVGGVVNNGRFLVQHRWELVACD